MARYLTVRSAGYIESVRDDVAGFFVERVALDVVTRRVRSGLRKGEGAQGEQLMNFAGTFHASWKTELGELLAADERRLSNLLGSLVAARKKIAHGDGDNVDVKRALAWAVAAEDIGSWFIRRFDPAKDAEIAVFKA